jgi:hypothetical protein
VESAKDDVQVFVDEDEEKEESIPESIDSQAVNMSDETKDEENCGSEIPQESIQEGNSSGPETESEIKPQDGTEGEPQKVRFRVVSLPNPVLTQDGTRLLAVSALLDGKEGIWQITMEENSSLRLKPNTSCLATIWKVKEDERKMLVVGITEDLH